MGVPAITPLRGELPGSGDAAWGSGGRPPSREPAPRLRVSRLPDDSPLMPPLAARLIAFVALTAFGAVQWMQMVEPPAGARGWRAVGAALLIALALIAVPRLPSRLRPPALVAIVLAALGLAMLAGGLADEQLLPSAWGDVSAIVGRGIDGLPGARIPYRGLDPDVRAVIPLGGAALAALAALVAFWPRRRRTGFPAAAVMVLVTLYAVPAVALIGTAQFVRGAVLVVLVVAFLRLERLRRRDAAAAGALAGAVAITALVIAPALDSDQPWWDYESWSQSAAGAKSTSFNWNHDYGPLDWPRDGRELLRIKSHNRAYWKTDALDTFDGVHWVEAGAYEQHPTLEFNTNGIELSRLRRWTFPIKVSVRNLRSETLPIAGSTDAIYMPRQSPGQIRPGIWSLAGREIHRGDSYTADVYVPQPSVRDLRTAGTTYVGRELRAMTHFTVRTHAAAPGVLAPLADRQLPIAVPDFGADPLRLGPLISTPAQALIEDSDLANIYALSRQLLADAATPYEYVRSIERYLDNGFVYSEQPPDSSRTLDGFLFKSKIGYCQQFSGAMALLLRMGGVPARVITGFAPGSLDRKTNQYVVRDLDAHSWVEAWFPGIGWVVFDPTPSTAPPRSQAGAILPSAGLGDARDLGQTRQALGTGHVGARGQRSPWPLILAGILALGALALSTRALVRRTRALRHAPATSELERALRIAGGGLAPATTLTALEARFASTPGVGYLRALRAQRYTPAGRGPTPAQRRGLRRALAHGSGPFGFVRALRALPPRLRHRG